MKSVFFKSSAIFVFAALTSMFVLSSCDDKESDVYLDVNADLVTFSPAGGIITVAVKTNTGDWTYSLAGNDWISDEKTETGVKLSTSANPQTGIRKSTLTITSSKAGITQTVAITQAPYSPYLVVTTSSPVDFDAEGEEVLVAVDTNVDDWTFSLGEDDWLTGEQTPEGVKLTAPINDLPAGNRTATLTIASEAAKVETSVVLNQSSCFVASLVLSVESPVTLDENGDELTIVVNSNVPDWTVGSNQSWLKVERTGPNVKISAERNTGSPRTAVLSFTSARFPVINKNIQVEQERFIVEGLPASWILPFKGTVPAAPGTNDYYTNYAANDGTAHVGLGQWWLKSDDGNSIFRGHRAATPEATQAWMSYSTYQQPGNANQDRVIMYGLQQNDYWQMEIPTLGIAAGTSLRIETHMQASGTGPGYFLFQYSTDKNTWTNINPQTDGSITYTIKMLNAATAPFSETFTIASAIPKGMFYIRLLVNSSTSANGGATLGTGGTSWVTRPVYTDDTNKIPIMKVSKL